jgi:multiple sugar transport system ATP-binding protein
VAVISGDGRNIRLPAPPATPQGWGGRDVVLGIRPECIAERSRSFGDDPSTTLSVNVPVEMVEPTGAESIVLMRFGAEKILGRIAPDIRLPTGKMADFAVDTRKICLFDPTTERLIA